MEQAAEQGTTEVVDIFGSAVCQRVFDGVPGGLDGVELWSVGGQAFQIQPGILAAQLAQGLRIVNGGAVPHDADAPAQVTQQIPQEVIGLVLGDILRMHTEVQPESPPAWADRQSADHRDAITTIVVSEFVRPVPTCVARVESS